jgi:hypothetical protein
MKPIFNLLLILALGASVAAFVPRPHVGVGSLTNNGKSSLQAVEALSELDESRFQFFFWFFGGSGGAGIARSAFPRMFGSFKEILDLKGVGPSLGGETIGISPLTFYPQDLSRKDVEKIVTNKAPVAEIVKKHPVEGNFLAAKGYLTYPAFKEFHKDANPLAVRAVFDTFAQSTDCVSPDIAQGKLDSFRENVDNVKDALLWSKLTGIFAIGTLLFLLGLADVIAAYHAYHGWFPDWPGGVDFPSHLFESGFQEIPKYWI